MARVSQLPDLRSLLFGRERLNRRRRSVSSGLCKRPSGRLMRSTANFNWFLTELSLREPFVSSVSHSTPAMSAA